MDGPGSGSVLSLTDEGKRVMLEDPPVSLSLPRLGRPIRSRRGGGASPPPASIAPVDEDLVERIREWRLGEARTREVPAYAVFSDRTMLTLAAVKPTNRAELLTIPGIGPARLERYGDSILEVLGGSSP